MVNDKCFLFRKYQDRNIHRFPSGKIPTHIKIFPAHHPQQQLHHDSRGKCHGNVGNVGPPTKALLGLFKEISDATGTDAREDLHEFGGRDAEEGHARLSRSKPLGLTGIWVGKNQHFWWRKNCLYWYKCICIFTIHESKLPYLIKLVLVDLFCSSKLIQKTDTVNSYPYNIKVYEWLQSRYFICTCIYLCMPLQKFPQQTPAGLAPHQLQPWPRAFCPFLVVPPTSKGTKGFMEGITENHNNQKADMCRLMKHTGSCWKKNLEKSLVFQKKAITAKNPWHVWVVLGDLSNFK